MFHNKIYIKFLKERYYPLIIMFLFGIFSSCDEADYQLDNPNDPLNMDLIPPAIFFHPLQKDTLLYEQFKVEIYGLELNPAAGVQIGFDFERSHLDYNYIVPGPFFKGINDPLTIVDTLAGSVKLYLYYLPDIESDQSKGGTQSIATIYFTTKTKGQTALEFDTTFTKLRDANNDSLRINQFQNGIINVQ